MNKNKINQYLETLSNEVKDYARKYYLEGAVKRVFEIKPGVYSAIVQHHSLEQRVTISFKGEQLLVNCGCETYKTHSLCHHITAVLYYLLEHPMLQKTVFSETTIDSLIYSCDEKTAKEYLDYELSRSQYKRELIKFLFFRLRNLDLSQDDYQYIFDFLYTLSDSQDRLKVLSRLYDTLFDRFRMKLVESNYREALLILKEMIINETDIESDIENNLSYFEDHLSKNMMHIKTCIKYLSIYVDMFNDIEKHEYHELLIELASKAKIYVACCTEIKHLIFEHDIPVSPKLCEALKDMYSLLVKCSDVCRQSTVELIFKIIDPRDRDYPFFKAIYSELLFNRAYNPSNLNLDLLEKIKALNEDSYSSDINQLARVINEKNSQKQWLDVLVNDENWIELGRVSCEYPSLRHLYIYYTQIKAAYGNGFGDLMMNGLNEFISKFPTEIHSSLLTYIYMDEGEPYFILLVKSLQSILGTSNCKDLVNKYLQVKYRVISKDLPLNHRVNDLYNSL